MRHANNSIIKSRVIDDLRARSFKRWGTTVNVENVTSNRGRSTEISLFVILSVTLTAAFACSKKEPPPPPPPDVEVAAVVQRDVPIYIELVGSTLGSEDVDAPVEHAPPERDVVLLALELEDLLAELVVRQRREVRVGDSVIDGQLARALEDRALERVGCVQLERAGLTVERRLNLGGTFICDRALRSGDIDVYVEYTGTADTAVFKAPVDTDPARVLDRVRRRYADGGLTLMAPLGFENTFAILVRGDDARRLRLRTIEDAASVSASRSRRFQ